MHTESDKSESEAESRNERLKSNVVAVVLILNAIYGGYCYVAYK
jgi:hypothetical protein